MTYWIDTHCHLADDRYKNDFDSYIQKAKENDVAVINVICSSKEELLYMIEKQKQYPNLDISFGYYPQGVEKITQEDLDFLVFALDNYPQIKAIGEIGLDYYYTKEFAQKQKELFIKQIEIANRYNKPLIIHSRSAAKDTYDTLKQYAKTNVLMHCYSDSLEMMKEYQKLGYFISFTGVVTFKNANKVKTNAINVDLDKIMIETDSPYLTPAPFRGKENQPAYVRFVGEYISGLRDIEIEKLQLQLIDNYQRFMETCND
ncbi:MAG: TatD family hydrolase [Bacillota bacterium]|jgi:TatD DNase family protein|nr:TatD family hydrolase [Bacillota bacterium]NLL26275.1 TatD family hydrolase [Erysipelotrichia bacterium]